MPRERTVEWLNEMRHVVNSAVKVVFQEGQGLLDEYNRSPELQQELADAISYIGPNVDITPTDTQALVVTIAGIFDALTPEARAAIYKFRAHRNVPGR